MGQGVDHFPRHDAGRRARGPLESVDMVMGDTDLCPWDVGTWGSMSTRFFGPPLRAAAAKPRAVLIELGAEYLQTPLPS